MALLTGGIAKIVTGATKAVTYPIQLLRSEVIAKDESWRKDLTEEKSYPCRGMMGDYKESDIDGTRIQIGDRKCLIIAGSISVVPVPGDKIIGQEETYHVINVGRDPASATYSLQVRR